MLIHISQIWEKNVLNGNFRHVNTNSISMWHNLFKFLEVNLWKKIEKKKHHVFRDGIAILPKWFQSWKLSIADRLKVDKSPRSWMLNVFLFLKDVFYMHFICCRMVLKSDPFCFILSSSLLCKHNAQQAVMVKCRSWTENEWSSLAAWKQGLGT